jgi:nickel/cobalt transporter (NicO) family protein
VRDRLITILTCVATVMAADRSAAHPVPSFTYDRTIRVKLTAKSIVIDYRIELNDFTIFKDGSEIIDAAEFARLNLPRKIRDAFAKAIAPHMAERLMAWQDGSPLVFRLANKPDWNREHLYFDFVFTAEWPAPPALGQKFRLNLEKPPRDSIHLENGRIDLAFAADPTVSLANKVEPSAELRAKTDLNPAEFGSAVFRQLAATIEPVEQKPEPPLETLTPAPPSKPPSTISQLRKRGLTALLESDLGLGLLLLLALGFGAAHALTPGHGKTLVAAYLVGERGTVGHAVLLGIVTTVTHTGVVIILAAMLPWLLARVAVEHVQAILGFVGGILIAGMGLWLLLKRLSGQADHVHLGGADHHHHGHGHHHHDIPSGDKVRIWNLIMLGVSGGIVPCWDAIALLAWSIAAHQVRLGLPLLLAFSAGLAGVLVLVGVLVVKLKGFGSSKLGEGRLVKALPILSAIAVTLLGAWLCLDSVTGK